MYYNRGLKELSLLSLTSCGRGFLAFNKNLQELSLPRLSKKAKAMLEFGTHVRDLIDNVNKNKKALQSNLLREIYLNNENASQ